MDKAEIQRPPEAATVLPFPQKSAHQPKPVHLAGALKQLSIAYPTRQQMLILVNTWLYAAERDGITLRQPEYADAVKRAISALERSQSLAQAITLLRAQEAALGERS